MSTATETETIPDWALGYAMALPCAYKACPNEAEWFGDQHKCAKAYLCEDHLMKIKDNTDQKIAYWGAVICPVCHEFFKTFDSFIKAVRI